MHATTMFSAWHPARPLMLRYRATQPALSPFLRPCCWLAPMCELPARGYLLVGAPQRLRAIAARNSWRWVRGHAAPRRLYALVNE